MRTRMREIPNQKIMKKKDMSYRQFLFGTSAILFVIFLLSLVETGDFYTAQSIIFITLLLL